MTGPSIGVLGIDHGHIFGMLSHLLARGATFKAWWTHGPAVTEPKFRETYPGVPRTVTKQAILDDPGIDLILIAAVPADRAALAAEAMRHGKDVMTDKPGCTTLEQLEALQRTQYETGRIWSVNFSERFQVPAVARAEELVAEGAIGRVVQVVTLAPHKQNLSTRPPWYFERARYGGILTDIGSHQIDQVLYFTGSSEARILHAHVENTTRPEYPGFQDYGEASLATPGGHGFIRVDWFTPDGLPTWGDGRLFLLGTEGTIEIRKYTDIGQPHRTDTLYLVNRTENTRIDCAGGPLPYFDRLLADIRDRSETAMPQTHPFAVMELAIRAQELAERG
ncbi:Gfo/Idh/MocA family protein [Ovoidimarina sediminis]|uniref:Gfo/Idh/MocA family protein n=1 Tax=Ovoidimarina sediminis TaxID=3079856 RepID=UPI002912D49F|nr:Gfo/Idh/MocA family oxidoreductase [Rhodophyticola sp. MJ-SS7]MDU8943245.1 Gfo/Idh/MocA family oxidoreductase [Rhodophyticola sp. MJ-SS7]